MCHSEGAQRSEESIMQSLPAGGQAQRSISPEIPHFVRNDKVIMQGDLSSPTL